MKKLNNMNTANIEQTIAQSNGKFFSILYKKNQVNDVNKYVVRTGVKKGLKGGTNHCPDGAVTLYCVSKNGDSTNFGFRSFYIEKIVEIKSKAI